MHSLRSETPSPQNEKQVQELKNEFVEYNSSLDGSLGLGIAISYEDWLERIKIHQSTAKLPKSHVITNVYIAVRESDDKIIGIFNIRHHLNSALKLSGNGNIGYCVRPMEQKKGYGTQLIKMALEKCGKLGMKTVHISCYEQNIASRKLILKNSGLLYREHHRKDGKFLEYKIEI